MGHNLSLIHIYIFEHPVSFAVESHANVGTPEEALSASLNKFGTVDIDYMRTITDSTAEELLTALQGRIDVYKRQPQELKRNHTLRTGGSPKGRRT